MTEQTNPTRNLVIHHCNELKLGAVQTPDRLASILTHQLPTPAKRNSETDEAAFKRWGVLDDWNDMLDAAVRFTHKMALVKLVEEKDNAVTDLAKRVQSVEFMDAQVQALP